MKAFSHSLLTIMLNFHGFDIAGVAEHAIVQPISGSQKVEDFISQQF